MLVLGSFDYSCSKWAQHTGSVNEPFSSPTDFSSLSVTLFLIVLARCAKRSVETVSSRLSCRDIGHNKKPESAVHINPGDGCSSSDGGGSMGRYGVGSGAYEVGRAGDDQAGLRVSTERLLCAGINITHPPSANNLDMDTCWIVQ